MDCLPDQVLIEILCRLPCSKSANRCKSVCKRWSSFISSPYFIDRFIAHHDNGDHKGRPNSTSSFSLIFRPITFCQPKGQMLSPRDTHSETTTNGFSNQFLPDLFTNVLDKESVKVIAACNDLLLCCTEEKGKWPEDRDLYICNPQTKEWFILPRPAHCYERFLAGLVCDPYYTINNNKVNTRYRYRVVCVLDTNGDHRTQFNGQIFSSESGKWDEVVLSSPKPFQIVSLGCGSLFYDGMLYFHFHEGKDSMIAFDPFACKKDIGCHFVDWPTDTLQGLISQTTFGICQGRLRISQSQRWACPIWIWDLKDYRTSEWQLQHKVIIREFVARDPVVRAFVHHGSLIKVLGLHPFRDDGVYLQVNDLVIFCDLKRRTLEKVWVVPPEFGAFQTNDGLSIVFWLMQQWWPTPLRSKGTHTIGWT